MARREHMIALQREFLQLQALSPAEASGWQQRREWAAASKIQMSWRQRGARRSFLDVVERSQLHRRAKAATAIQRKTAESWLRDVGRSSDMAAGGERRNRENAHQENAVDQHQPAQRSDACDA